MEVVSEQSQRKALYQKIMPLFPDGWMNTGYISREGAAPVPILLPPSCTFLLVPMLMSLYLVVSIMKKKFESLNKTAEENTTGKAAAEK